MDDKALAEYLDQTRWLLNNGLINDGVKNQLFVYGSIVHKDVRAVEVDIQVADKVIDYKIYIDKELKEKIDRYTRICHSDKILDMWRFKRLLKKEGNLNFQHILNQFVRDYCGPQWTAKVDVLSITGYVEGYQQESAPTDLQSDKQLDG